MAIGQQLLNVPMGDMIRQMAFAIADAQMELDESSIRVAELMSGQYPLRDSDGDLVDKQGKPTSDPVYVDSRVFFGEEKDKDGKLKPAQVSMMELGFTPTFYQFIETLIEVKISIRITREITKTKKTHDGDVVIGSKSHSSIFSADSSSKLAVSTSTVDAGYAAKYSYSAEGSSLLRTKMVPVPPPAILEERIRKLIEDREANKPA
jgi:hypothetical protein